MFPKPGITRMEPVGEMPFTQYKPHYLHCLTIREAILLSSGPTLTWTIFPLLKGAAGSYNLLVGDTDGQLGSGATGRIIIDAGDPERGFKSYDWWGTIRSTSQGWRPEFKDVTFSGIGWDRWILRNLYTSGGDAGFFWDLTNKSGRGFYRNNGRLRWYWPCFWRRNMLSYCSAQRTKHFSKMLFSCP